MAAKKPKMSDSAEVPQSVVIEGVSPKVEEAHKEAVKEAASRKEIILAVLGVLLTLGTAFQAYFQWRTAELAKESAVLAREAAVKVGEVAVKAEEVKQTLDESTQDNQARMKDLKKTADANHVLLNSASLVTLKLLADVTRWKAEQTGDPDHIKAAELAEKNVREHEAKQTTADAQTK